ncbi:MAG TPA: CDP-diacylglycerol--serine O-phosphatidyltransferase [Thermoanaerobaculia bacterium]|jgi:CDP-diacylglycerol--serine O-phosphatidyltransferase
MTDTEAEPMPEVEGRRRRRRPGERRARPRVRQGLRRGAYLLPSLFTIGNVLLGFYAVVLGFRGRFDDAAVMVIIAGILDALDGRIARLTGNESEFGKELDSLADVLTFGSAPALLAFLWGLEGYGRVGWLVPLFYLLCAAIRLARFNVQTRTVDSRFFVGLPAPAAAGALVALLFAAPTPNALLTWASFLRPELVEGFMILALIVIGGLMVSTFRYPSFKNIDLRQRWSYRAFMAVAAGVLVLAYRPAAFLLSAAGIYTLSGPVGWLWGFLWGRLRRRDEEAPAAQPDSSEPA